MKSWRARLRLLTLPLLLVIVACVPENRPETCADDAVTVDLTVRADGMEPANPSVCSGQDVTLGLSSEVDGVFHIHGLDESVPATTIAAGQGIQLEFTAEETGQFPIELHLADDPQGVSIGILTIYDR